MKVTIYYNTIRSHGHLGWTLSAATADMIAGIVQQSLGGSAQRGVLRAVEV